MSRKAELSENLLATRLERFLVWAIDRRVQILTSLGVVVAAALIASVFVLRRNEQLNAARTRLGYAQALISQGKPSEVAEDERVIRAYLGTRFAERHKALMRHG